jgi:predicted DsbA family dithiol-disulfide isomerase
MEPTLAPAPADLAAPSSTRIAVEVWSDVVCPWCYVGKRRFETALAGFAHRDAVDVTFRSFQLDPTAPASYGTNSSGLLAAKYGLSEEKAAQMNAEMTALAAAEGLDYHLADTRPGNTFDAHRLVHLAEERGLGLAMSERLFRGYFTEALAIGDHAELVRMAAEVGLDPAEAEAVLAGDAYADAVRADIEEARNLGCQGVPFFVVNRTYGVSGAQTPAHLLDVLERAWADTAG